MKKIVLVIIAATLNLVVLSQTSFVKGLKLNTVNMTEAVCSGDINNDGLDDIVASIRPSFGVDSTLLVYIQNTDNSLDIPQTYAVVSRSYNIYNIIEAIAIEDVNNDGLNDVIVGFGDSIGIFYQNNSGTLDPAIKFYSGNTVFSLRVGDINNDSLADIVVTHHNELFIRIFYQQPIGFYDTTLIKPSDGEEEVDIGDLNGDGLNDVVLMSSSHYAPKGIHLYLQNNSGTLNNYTSYLDPTNNVVSLKGVALGDFNNDGATDVVALRPLSNDSSFILFWFQDTVSNSLLAPVKTSINKYANTIEAADLNCNGKLEIITLSGSSDYLNILHQDSTGEYVNQDNYQKYTFNSTHPGPHSLCSGDINNDGRIDIVSVNIESAVDLAYNSTINYRTISICQGDSIFLEGAFQSGAGIYNDTILHGSFLGCDSIISTTLILLNPIASFTVLNNLIVTNTSIGNGLTYFWEFGDRDTSTLPFPTHTYLTNGPFNLCLTISDVNGCISSTFCDSIDTNGIVNAGFTINVMNGITAINDLKGAISNLSIYPNPAQGIVNIELDLSTPKPINIVITDLLGNNIKTLANNSSDSPGRYIWNTGNTSSGIYLINVRVGELIQVKKVVLNR